MMKLPSPLLLFSVSFGFAGISGWQVYELLPFLGTATRDAATQTGMTDGTDKLGIGRASAPDTAQWSYTIPTLAWWEEFKAANFLGARPAPPSPPPDPSPPPGRAERRLEEIIELVSLAYDGKDAGRGEGSHVIVRYKPEANVQPPEWYMRETTVSTPEAQPRDVAARLPANQKPNRSAGPMPSSIGRDIVQRVWIQGDGNPRRDPKLWPPFDHIELVRVAADAQSAFFVRHQETGEPKEERLFKNTWGMTADLLNQLNEVQAGGDARTQLGTAPGATSAWVEGDETIRIGNVHHIGRQDERDFRENADELLANLDVDTYVSQDGARRGLIVRSVGADLAARFGINTGDVLLTVNGRAVTTRAQAMQSGKVEYRNGVRRFVMKWLSKGREVERIFQAPDR